MTDHLFKLGQMVALKRPLPDRTGFGKFEVIRLLPAAADGELQYRVRGPDKIERAVGESHLSKSAVL